MRKLPAALLVLSGLLATSTPYAATIIHTNDVLGELEPCGCRTNPQGGMARKSSFLKKLDDQQILQLDAGDLLFSTTQLPELLEKQAELQAGYLLKSMDMTRHDAVVPGEKDFALGVKAFDKLRKQSKIKFLAANLVRKNGSKYLEKDAIFVKKDKNGKSVRIAVFGLVGESLAWPRELKATPAIAAAKKEVAALRKKADFVVALTHQGFDKDKELASQVPGIDLIIGGHSQSFLQTPARIGNTLIYQSSFRNQYVGEIPLEKPLQEDHYRLVGLDPGYDSAPESPSEMDRLVKEFKKAVADLNTRQEAQIHAESEAANAKHAGASQAKFQTFPRCAECHLKQFDFWRTTSHANALTPLIEKEQFKNKECLTCHTVGFGDPQGFKDVSRLAEVKQVEAGVEDPQTVPWATEELAQFLKAMHKAGSLEEKIKLRPSDQQAQPLRRGLSAIGRSWTPVQCENCHQPGRDHPFSGSYSKAVDKNTCFKCHTPDRAPDWYTQSGQPNQEKINAKLKSITCPAGELSETAD